ncbi:hypothetical protein C8Q80DRAFT_1100892 [Daedaleopsis nitida]|nr:hypothetical protein C8Q80DRAFT_1100892 [Daedaleopsis nitida]
MSQPPNHTGPVQQPDPTVSTQYVSMHRAHVSYGAVQPPEGYAHHVLPYVPGPPQGSQGSPSEMMYPVDPQEVAGAAPPQSQQTADLPDGEGSPTQAGHAHGVNGHGSASANGNGKRKQPDSGTPDASGRKRRQRAVTASVAGAAAGAEDGEEVQDMDVGPNGGAKHWTEEEKTRFFRWMLTSDEHWDAFRTRMNTVFRECSTELFPGRKSYTALKSCYHRNLEVFKQVHGFQVFSANHLRQLQTENPRAEQPAVETMLDTARAAGLNVGNLNVKVIDRWYETGWYELFKKRYREDPKTGIPAPYYGPSDQPAEAGPSSSAHGMMGIHTPIDPQLISGHSGQHGPDPSYSGESSQQTYTYSPPPQAPEHRQGPTAAPTQSFSYFRSGSTATPRASHVAPATPTPARASSSRVLPIPNGNRHSPLLDAPPAGSSDYAPQTTQVLMQLTSVTESLLGVCSSLKELLQQQVEESKARTELMRAEAAAGGQSTKDKEKEITIEKVTFATEILKNGPQNEEIKKAAVDCLTKYFMRSV